MKANNCSWGTFVELIICINQRWASRLIPNFESYLVFIIYVLDFGRCCSYNMRYEFISFQSVEQTGFANLWVSHHNDFELLKFLFRHSFLLLISRPLFWYRAILLVCYIFWASYMPRLAWFFFWNQFIRWIRFLLKIYTTLIASLFQKPEHMLLEYFKINLTLLCLIEFKE